jgi:hypothetical protein
MVMRRRRSRTVSKEFPYSRSSSRVLRDIEPQELSKVGRLLLLELGVRPVEREGAKEPAGPDDPIVPRVPEGPWPGSE